MTTPEHTDKGSYNFSSFSGSEQEYARLKVQALIAWELEKNALLSVGLESGKNVIDIGCGPAFISQKIAELVSPSSVTGIEADDLLLRYAQITQQDQDNLEVIRGDAYQLPLEDASFDFGYALAVVKRMLPSLSMASTLLNNKLVTTSRISTRSALTKRMSKKAKHPR